MLQGIYENPKLITSPVIDAINDTTFFYRFIEKDIFGLMNWRMEFEWYVYLQIFFLFFLNFYSYLT